MKPLHLTDAEFIESVNRLGMTLKEFCESANLSMESYEDLMTSYGGQNYLLEQLDKVAAQTITMGDAVNCLAEAGITYIIVTSHAIKWTDDKGTEFSVRLFGDYKARQGALRHVMDSYS